MLWSITNIVQFFCHSFLDYLFTGISSAATDSLRFMSVDVLLPLPHAW